MGFLDTLKQVPLLGNIVGAFDQDAVPSQRAADIQLPTQDLISGQNSRAGESDQEVYDQRMRNVDQSGVVAQAHKDLQDKERALGGPDHSAMLQAIQNKAAKNYISDLNQIQRTTRQQAPLELFKRKQIAADSNIRRQELLAGIAQREQQKYINEQTARNNVLGSFLGAAGTVVGAVVGGPAGAAVGSQMGKAVAPQGQAQTLGGGMGYQGAAPGQDERSFYYS